jgi:undecaprenyl-diphosphatase
MSPIVALILGVIQGLTEFIPISSTAHLTIAATMLGVIDPQHPERWTAFMATIQLGTLAAVLSYFRRDVVHMTVAFFRDNVGRNRRPLTQQSSDARMAWFVIIGTIPIVVVGLLFKDLIEGQLTKSLTVIGSSLIGVALLLWWADRRASFSKTSSQITTADAIWIGCSQILALIPGSSRSGTTIMAGLFRGLTREHAARFSFLLSIPAILGSGILQFIGELEHITWTDGGLNLVIATVASAVSGYWSIAFLLRYLRSRSLSAFIIYRIALGLVILLVGCSPERDRGDRAGIDRIDTIQVDSMQGASETPSVTDLEDSIVITQQVLVQTSLGRIRIGLYGKDAPLTVQNFLDLVKRRYYDGVLFHRVAKGFVIQTGDPTTRDASARRSWGRDGERQAPS